MSYTIKFEHPPSGYSLTSARKGDENVQVVFREFLTSEDGMILIQRLEGFPSKVIGMLPTDSGIKTSQVDHMLLHFNKDGDATVYVNELAQRCLVRVRNDVEKGQAAYEDDIVDIDQLKFEGIDVPKDHGVLVIFSKGWRKGLFFDFEPIHLQGKHRDYNLWTLLGQCYNYLLFQEVHSISDEEWEALFAAKWFPFVGLNGKTIKELLSWIRSGHSADEVLSNAAIDVKSRLNSLRKHWASSPIFEGHDEVLNTAADRFEANDWISANSILYPRIEGILRNVARATKAINFRQTLLAKAPHTLGGLPATSRVFPTKFQRYLREIYFQNFNPDEVVGLSRNTVGHGVAPSSEFSEKAAVIGLLIIDQIFYHIPPITIKEQGYFGDECNDKC